MHKTINATRKPIFLYPGRDDNNNYPAVALGNALIAGSTGTGKTVLLKSILYRLITEYSPEDVHVYYWDGKGMDCRPWLTEDVVDEKVRIIPHVQFMSLHTNDNKLVIKSSLTDSLVHLREIVYTRRKIYGKHGCKNIYDYNDMCPEARDKHIIFIADDCQCGDLNDASFYMLNEILRVGRCVGVYVIFASVEIRDNFPQSLMNLFTLRLCLRADERTSVEMLGTDIAKFGNMPAYGQVYYKDLNTDVAPKLLHVTFYEDSYIKKIAGALSIESSVDDYFKL